MLDQSELLHGQFSKLVVQKQKSVNHIGKLRVNPKFKHSMALVMPINTTSTPIDFSFISNNSVSSSIID